jgi:hypothetical protein
MAEAKFTVKWTSDIRELRKSFAEFDKLEKRQHKGRDAFRKKEEKAHKDEVKRTKELFGYREKQLKKEATHYQKVHQTQQRIFKEQDRAFTTSGRTADHERRKQKAHDREKEGFFKRQFGTPGKGVRGFLSGAAGFAAGGLIGILMGAAFKGYENFNAVHKQLGGGIGLGTGNLLRNASRSGRGGNLGFNIGERAAIEPGMARATGFGGSEGIRQSMVAQRATGMEAGEVAEAFGAIRSGAGATAGKPGQVLTQQRKFMQQFADIQAAATASKLPKALRPEFIHGVSEFVQQQAQRLGGAISGGGFAQLAAAVSRLGGAGLQGGRGMGLMQQFSSAMGQQGGGEEASFFQRAMGFGRAGSNTHFGQAERMREQGLTDPKNFERVMKQALAETGGDREQASEYLRGVGATNTLSQGDELIKAFDAANGDMTQAMAKVAEIQEKNAPLEKQAADAMKEANTRLELMAHKFDESISIGAKSANLLDLMEKKQMEFVKFIFEKVPEIMKDVKFLAQEFKDFIVTFKQGINKISPFGKVFDVPDPQQDKGQKLQDRIDRYKTTYGMQFGKQVYDPSSESSDYQMDELHQRAGNKLAYRAAGAPTPELAEKVFQWGMKQDAKDLVNGKSLPPDLLKEIAAALKSGNENTKKLVEHEERKVRQPAHASSDPGTNDYQPGKPTGKGAPRARHAR